VQRRDRATDGILLAATGAGVASLVIGATSKSSDVGPWLALAGALLVAVLTAVFTRARQKVDLNAAQQRQQAALDAEDLRQRAALDAEHERVALQLEHDRHMADVADLRRVLEESLRTNHERRAVVREWRDRGEQNAENLLNTFRAARESVDCLRIRLHFDDPLYQAMARLDMTLETLVKAMTADAETWRTADTAWRAAYHDAVRAAQLRVGARID
jgi:hypothetical protein